MTAAYSLVSSLYMSKRNNRASDLSVKEYQLYSVIPTLLFLFQGYFWPGLFALDKAYKLDTQASEKGLVCIAVPIAVLVLES